MSRIQGLAVSAWLAVCLLGTAPAQATVQVAVLPAVTASGR